MVFLLYFVVELEQQSRVDCVAILHKLDNLIHNSTNKYQIIEKRNIHNRVLLINHM